jgi:4-hydroxy-2-oxoheptanedioate aldolase
LRHLFAANRTAVAGWMSIDSAYAAEVVDGAGFEAVVVDKRHGMADPSAWVAMLQALECCESSAAVPHWDGA